MSVSFDVIAHNRATPVFRAISQDAGRVGLAVNSIGTAVGNLASQGISAGFQALKGFTSGAVDAFAAVEDATGAASVQFGKALPDVLAFAETATKSFGLSERQAIEAANTFGTLGKSAGLQEKPLAEFSSRMTGLAGDLASFKGTSTEDAITAIGAALRGESEPIRRYGVLLDDATLRQEALAMGLIKTTKDALTPQQKVLAAQSAIIKQTKDATGDFARTSDSTANTQKTLQAATENLQASLGEKLAPTFTSVRRGALEFINGLTGGSTEAKGFAGFANTAGQRVRQFGDWLNDPFIPAVQKGTKFLSENKTAISVLAGAVGALFVITKLHTAFLTVQAAGGLLKYAASTRLVTALTKTWTAVQWALNFALRMNPIGIVITVLAALGAGLVIAYKKSDTFRSGVQTLWGWLKKFIGFTPLGALILNFDKVKAATERAWNKAKDFVKVLRDFKMPGWVSTLGDIVGKAGSALGSAWKWATGGGGDGIGMGSGAQPSGVRGMMAAVRSQFPGTALISGVRPGAVTPFGNRSYHSMGRAVDLPPSMAIFNWIRRNFGASSKELFFSPADSAGLNIHNGRPYKLRPITKAMHWDHVHWAMAQGGILREPVFGRGALTGANYAFAERGPEAVTPIIPIPGQGGMGRGNLTVIVNPRGHVLTDRDLAVLLRDTMRKMSSAGFAMPRIP